MNRASQWFRMIAAIAAVLVFLGVALRPVEASYGPYPTTYRRLALADAIACYDPGTRLATPVTDGGAGVGISWPLTGSWSSSDPMDWPHCVWAPKDAAGAALSTTSTWAIALEIAERTAPGLSSDTSIAVGVINESADSGTVDGIFGRLLWSGATRAGGAIGLANGAATVNTGTSNASIRYLNYAVVKAGSGATAVATISQARGALDSSRAVLAATVATTITTGTIGDNSSFIVVAAGRTAATAGNETVVVDTYTLPPVVAPLIP